MQSARLFKTEIEEQQKQKNKLQEYRSALSGVYRGMLEIDGRQIELFDELAAGGFKMIFELGDGKVIALRNTNDGLSDMALFGWEEGVEFELRMSDRLRKLGLYAQDYKKVEVKINGHIVPALIMTHFKSLLEIDQQIRCGGDKENFGTTMLFGSSENIKSESYLRELFRGVVSDIVTLIINKINLGVDSFGGIVITNTEQTPFHDKTAYDLITNRKQEVHLFLMDFYQKQLLFQHGDLAITDKRFNPRLEAIIKTADFYLRMASSSLCSAMTEFERIKLGQENVANIYDAYDEVYNKIEDSLLAEICTKVMSEIKAQKVSRFDRKPTLQRSLSSHSYFYHQDEEDVTELSLESIQELMRDKTNLEESKMLRLSMD